jgi:hypothetical protein
MRTSLIIGRRLLPLLTILLCTSRGYADGSTADDAALIGLTPEALVVASVDLAQATMMLNSIQSEGELRQNLQAAHQAADAAASAVTILAEALRQQPDDGQLVAQYDASASALQAARDQIELVRGQLFESATESASAEQVAKLLIWRSGNGFRVPPEFRAVERTADEWSSIEAALRAERRAARLNEVLDESVAQLLNTVRSHAAVTAAASQLQANLQAMQGLFDQFTNQ